MCRVKEPRVLVSVLGVTVKKNPNETGQGVVEYAGALIIATVIVSFALLAFPNAFTGAFFASITQILTFFSSHLPT